MDSILLLAQLLLFGLSALGVATSDWMRAAPAPHSLENLRNIAISLALMLLVSRLRPHWAIWAARPFFALSLVLLIANLFVGFGPGSERRFIDLPFTSLNIQASEFAKLSVVAYLAAFFHNKPTDYPIIGPTIAISLAAGLIIASPDLDSGLFVLLLSGFLLMVIGVPWRRLLAIGATAWILALSVSGLYLDRFEKVRDRFDGWSTYVTGRVNELDQEVIRGPLYQITQAHKIIVNAGLFGQGAGSRMPNLPESHSDFVLASIIWAGGWLAGFMVLVALWLILARGLQIAANLEGSKSVLALGLTLYLVLQAALNIAAVIGTVPIGGSPLPMVSMGGNSMIMAGLAMGLLQALSREAFAHKQEGRAKVAQQ